LEESSIVLYAHEAAAAAAAAAAGNMMLASTCQGKHAALFQGADISQAAPKFALQQPRQLL
jgi:cytochrome c5